MPLLDHFHHPLHPTFPWESFHGSWCNAIMRQLNGMLRPRYFAAFQVRLGAEIEADVAEYDRSVGAAATHSKCAAYLQRGLGVVLVDGVTSRQANLHNELLGMLHQPDPTPLEDSSLYAAAY